MSDGNKIRGLASANAPTTTATTTTTAIATTTTTATIRTLETTMGKTAATKTFLFGPKH